jgi:hypothetical protein
MTIIVPKAMLPRYIIDAVVVVDAAIAGDGDW